MEEVIHMHGGDLDAIERIYGIPKDEISDFSGNINPLGFPKKAAKKLAENISIVCNYPDKKYQALRDSIGKYTGADPENIVVCPFYSETVLLVGRHHKQHHHMPCRYG